MWNNLPNERIVPMCVLLFQFFFLNFEQQISTNIQNHFWNRNTMIYTKLLHSMKDVAEKRIEGEIRLLFECFKWILRYSNDTQRIQFFSYRTNLCKINEFGFEINWFSQIYPTLRKPKANQIHMSPDSIFLQKKKSNNNPNHVMQVRFKWLHNHKTIVVHSRNKKSYRTQDDTIGKVANPTFNEIVLHFCFCCITEWSTVTSHFK